MIGLAIATAVGDFQRITHHLHPSSTFPSTKDLAAFILKTLVVPTNPILSVRALSLNDSSIPTHQLL